jgi:predicted DNA-binding transcriptional regulator AlpA
MSDIVERHPHRVLTLREWAKLNSIGYRTAHRLIASGKGPRLTQLSDRRVGVREVDNAAWQASRVRDRA